jgi:hypothetical protein
MTDVNAAWDQLMDLLTGDDVAIGYRLQADIRAAAARLLEDERDRAYGKGHREGRELGHAEGWGKRDSAAEAERFGLEAQIQVLHEALEREQQRNGRGITVLTKADRRSRRTH